MPRVNQKEEVEREDIDSGGWKKPKTIYGR
jgi:hypothetical protein